MKRIMMKSVGAILIVLMMCVIVKADYQGVTEMDLNLRDAEGKVVDVIPAGETVQVTGAFNETRVNVIWNDYTGNVWNKIIETTPKAITTTELNLRNEMGDVIKLIPAGTRVNLVQEEELQKEEQKNLKKVEQQSQYKEEQKQKQEKDTDNKERTWVEYEGDKGTVLTEGLTNDFIFISIKDQMLSMYKENQLFCYGPTVTGTATDPERATPTGVFSIRWKEPDRYLKGRYFVKYWMPIYGNVGIHDADEWRSEYGGDIYINHGSHGCINLPRSLAKQVYDNSFEGMTVVVSSK